MFLSANIFEKSEILRIFGGGCPGAPRRASYYTAAVTNSFVRIINIEKRNQNIRDDILEMNHMNPSFTRQNQGQWEKSVERQNAKDTSEK